MSQQHNHSIEKVAGSHSILCVSLNPAVDVACEAAHVQPTHKIRTTGETHYPGGGAINVARLVKALGGDPELVFLTGGATGALLDDCLEPLAIRRHGIEIDEPTRIAFTVHEASTGHEYRFVPEGPVVTAKSLSAVDKYVDTHMSDFVVLSGTLPRGAPSDTYAAIARRVNELGGKVIVDCAGDDLATTLEEAEIYLAKPSIGELEKLAGCALDEPALKRFGLDLIASGAVQHLAVSMGSQGAFLISENRIYRAPSVRVDVRSAVGAGDSFVGAMVHALTVGEDMIEAFRYAVAAGAAAVMTPGTELAHVQDIENLLPTCQVYEETLDN